MIRCTLTRGGRGRRFSCFALLVVAASLAGVRVGADEWPQWRGPQRDGVWRETGIVERFDGPEIPIKWRAPISSGYTGPTVADNRVYVMDRIKAPVAKERVLCFAAETGAPVWTREYGCEYRRVGYPAGPRACVTIDTEATPPRAYSLGTMGHLHCLDAATGNVIWSHDLDRAYRLRVPTWGIAASPFIDGDLVIVQVGGSDGACLIAFDRNDGAEKWRALDDRACYSTPIIIEQAGRRILACLTGDSVVGLDPQTGQVHWRHPFPPRKYIIGVATPVRHREFLFITTFQEGSLLLRLREDEPAVEAVWSRRGASERQTDALHSTIATPYLEGDHIYGVDSYGEFRCLELMTGDRVWEDRTATAQARWATAHFIRHGSEVWLFNELGELIISRLSSKGFDEISRAKLIKPTTEQLPRRGGVCWSHPAFAYRHVFARSDEELVCADLSAR